MKKTILTTIVALFCLGASAQITVMSNVSTPEDNETWGVSNFTDNMGVGFSVRVWNNLYVEPNYTTKDDEGSFNIGLSYTL